MPRLDEIELPKRPAGSSFTLPELTGTAKQVIWAGALRVQMLAEMSTSVPSAVYDAARTITEAAWWIANRDRRPDDYVWPKTWLKTEAKAPENDLGIRSLDDLKRHRHWINGGEINLKGVKHRIEHIALVHNEATGTLRLCFFNEKSELIYVAKEMQP